MDYKHEPDEEVVLQVVSYARCITQYSATNANDR